MDNLARAAFMARQEGLSYGQYMAKHGTNPYAKKKPVKLDRICPQCGAEIPRQKGKQKTYCSVECRSAWHHERQRKLRRGEL